MLTQSLNSNSSQLFINNNKSLKVKDSSGKLLSISDQAGLIKKMIERQRSTFLFETRRPKTS
jgi:hypothetical protein